MSKTTIIATIAQGHLRIGLEVNRVYDCGPKDYIFVYLKNILPDNLS